MCAGTCEHWPGVYVCVCTPTLFLACVSMCIIMCVFYGPCALVCVGCCAHPCELLCVSGSHPSPLLCSPRSLLLASLSSPVLLRCRMLCVQLCFTLFYSTLVKGFANVYFMIQIIIFVFDWFETQSWTAG